MKKLIYLLITLSLFTTSYAQETEFMKQLGDCFMENPPEYPYYTPKPNKIQALNIINLKKHNFLGLDINSDIDELIEIWGKPRTIYWDNYRTDFNKNQLTLAYSVFLNFTFKNEIISKLSIINSPIIRHGVMFCMNDNPLLTFGVDRDAIIKEFGEPTTEQDAVIGYSFDKFIVTFSFEKEKLEKVDIIIIDDTDTNNQG